MPRTRVTGGRALAKFMRASKKGVGKQATIDVGFHEPIVGRLASRLEFGDPNANLPERPAFRAGIGDLKRTLPGVVRRAVGGHDFRKGITVSQSAVVEVGTEARDTLKSAYLTFHGPGVGPAQAARKKGTVGEGRELVGSEGPRLVSRIEAKVDGEQI